MRPCTTGVSDVVGGHCWGGGFMGKGGWGGARGGGGPLSEAGLGQAAGSEAGGAALGSQLPWAEPGPTWIFLGPWGSMGMSGGIQAPSSTSRKVCSPTLRP